MSQEILLISLIVVAFTAVLGILLFRLTRRRHVSRDLAQTLLISNEWIVLDLDPALRPGKRLQEILLVIPGARFDLDTDDNFFLEGNVVDPELEVAGSDGVWHSLKLYGGKSNGDYDGESATICATAVGFRLPTPDKGGFLSLRVRSEKSFSCSKIRWHAYYRK